MIAGSEAPAPRWLGGKPLVIASHNEGKVAEIRSMIAPFNIRVLSAASAMIDEPEETGATFAANAELKARHATTHSHIPSLADDSGLVIPVLGGAPGVYSARWAGPNKDFTIAFERIHQELGNRAADAYFMCVLCLSLPSGETFFFEGRTDGILTFPPRGSHGFGYDPIFIPNGHAITFGEMDADQKNCISHRARAFEKFVTFVQQS